MGEYIRRIKALSEVVLRVRDMDTMQEFYEKVVGLELLERSENMMAFFRIAPDYEGHTQSLALFDQSCLPTSSAHWWAVPRVLSHSML